METIHISGEVQADGKLQIDAETCLPPGPVDVVLVVQPSAEATAVALHWADLEGLGKEIWNGVDAQQYVNELRDEWEK